MNGVINLDKPTGISSNGVLTRLKRLIGESKMGFVGTLDPMAQGVLPVFVGKATKLIPNFEGHDKEYRVTLRLGERTDTFDTDGNLIERRDASHLDEARVREAILAFQGEIIQVAPAYSAVKHNGVPAYRLARQGKPVPEKRRRVRLCNMVVERVDLPEVTFRVVCTPGTYMRSLGEEIGKRLEVGAAVSRLIRLRCGNVFRLENSVAMEAIQEAADKDDFAFVINPSDILVDHHPYTVGGAEERSLRIGRVLPLADGCAPPNLLEGPDPPRIKAIRPGGTLVAVGVVVRTREGGWGMQPTKVLV